MLLNVERLEVHTFLHSHSLTSFDTGATLQVSLHSPVCGVMFTHSLLLLSLALSHYY